MIRKAVEVMSGRRRADAVDVRIEITVPEVGKGRNLRECYDSLKKTKTGFDHQKCKPG
jgi:hypothetical protein